ARTRSMIWAVAATPTSAWINWASRSSRNDWSTLRPNQERTLKSWAVLASPFLNFASKPEIGIVSGPWSLVPGPWWWGAEHSLRCPAREGVEAQRTKDQGLKRFFRRRLGRSRVRLGRWCRTRDLPLQDAVEDAVDEAARL